MSEPDKNAPSITVPTKNTKKNKAAKKRPKKTAKVTAAKQKSSAKPKPKATAKKSPAKKPKAAKLKPAPKPQLPEQLQDAGIGQTGQQFSWNHTQAFGTLQENIKALGEALSRIPLGTGPYGAGGIHSQLEVALSTQLDALRNLTKEFFSIEKDTVQPSELAGGIAPLLPSSDGTAAQQPAPLQFSVADPLPPATLTSGIPVTSPELPPPLHPPPPVVG